MSEMFEVLDGQSPERAIIRVIGVGGGGCNTVNQMVEAEIEGVEFICSNTDRQHLDRSKAANILQIGAAVTRGLGAGSDPEKGRAAAEEDRDRIRDLLEGTDMLFLTAGMGGGTGTGAAPVIAEIARELDILTVAVVTKPFMFEGKKRNSAAVNGISELHKHVDSLILIPNEQLQRVLGDDATMDECFRKANDVLQNAVQGISDLITRPGQVNVDFADVSTVMRSRGKAMMGLGRSSGDDRAINAVDEALTSPLLDDIELTNAQGILVNVACDHSLKMGEINRIMGRVLEIASEDVDLKFGTSLDENLDGELRVTVVATGLGGAQAQPQPVHDPNSNVTPISRQPAADVNGQPRQGSVEVPAVMRESGGRVAVGQDFRSRSIPDEEVLNIPAFLRNQAD
ncbi:cell division protein FtsZ [Algiphilus sp.]|uniref:cell division protein FtsZ n=1 Tax=Algiphilus sp. TaxID=1872431 RepID=UPI0025BEA0A0|nr:cell division protein FtsZ [Algiphilus sp.]